MIGVILTWLATATATATTLGAGDCAGLLAATKDFVDGTATLADHAAWHRYLPRGVDLVARYVERGLARSFVARQLTGLAFARGPLTLRIFDANSPDYRAFVRENPERRLRRLHRPGADVPGVTYVTSRGGRAVTVVAVDPKAAGGDFGDVMMEEALHVRLRHHWALMEFENDHRPYVSKAEGEGLLHLLDELVAKEILYVFGRGRARNRAALLEELIADAARRGRRGSRGYDELLHLLERCGALHRTSWLDLPLARVLRCAYRL